MFQLDRTNDTRLDVRAASALVANIAYTDESGTKRPEIHFRLETFKDLSRDLELGEEILRPLNIFLKGIPFDKQEALYTFYAKARLLLDELNAQTFAQVTQELETITTELFTKTRLDWDLKVYVDNSSIPFPDLSHAGQRAHDTKEMTFHLPEYKELTAISLMCKIMSPIWGEYFRIVNSDMTDEINKEKFCYDMLLITLRDGAFKAVIEKLRNYVAKSTNTVLNQQAKHASPVQSPVKFTQSKNGFGEARFLDLVFAVIFARKMVIFNVYRHRSLTRETQSDIMNYISSNITATANSKISAMRTSTHEMIRIDPKDSRSEQDNVTFNDNNSRTSKVPGDSVIAASIGAQLEAERLIGILGIPKKVYEPMTKYYCKNTIVPNPLADMVMSCMYEEALGGSICLEYLDAKRYELLLSIAQIYAIKNNCHDVAHLLSCTTSTERNLTIHAPIQMNYKTMAEYTECVRTFSGSAEKHVPSWRRQREAKAKDVERVSIATQIVDIISWLVSYDHYYNSPNALWLVDERESQMNGDVIDYSDLIVKEMCRFILLLRKEDTIIARQKQSLLTA